jgi:hypothetical protein
MCAYAYVCMYLVPALVYAYTKILVKILVQKHEWHAQIKDFLDEAYACFLFALYTSTYVCRQADSRNNHEWHDAIKNSARELCMYVYLHVCLYIGY